MKNNFFILIKNEKFYKIINEILLIKLNIVSNLEIILFILLLIGFPLEFENTCLILAGCIKGS